MTNFLKTVGIYAINFVGLSVIAVYWLLQLFVGIVLVVPPIAIIITGLYSLLSLVF